MATGDRTGAKRPRYQANERFDVQDADAASRGPLEHNDAIQRALLTTPRATAGTSLPGLIVTGLSLTLNPTSGSDGKVRINTELGIAIDANGRYIIKPAGTTVDATIPSGTYQVYIYWLETPAETATRRFLTVQSPYTEYASAMSTSFTSGYGVYVRSGNNTNLVSSDVINGITTPLCIIGIATNTAGVITMTGYNATTAPNGTDIVNRMSSVLAPTTAPALNTQSGSPSTLHDMILAAAYFRGLTAFKGSVLLTPAAGNNFGAYTAPTIGVEALREDFVAEQVILHDKILQRLVPGTETTDDGSGAISLLEFPGEYGADITSSVYAYTLHGGQAYPKQGSSNNKVKIAPGTLFQKVQATDNTEPTWLAYTFNGTDEVTIGNGGGVNPRVDLIQMKLTWNSTTRRVDLTLNVKQGAASANPVYPTPDAGFVVIAGVVVPTSYSGAAGMLFQDSASATAAVLHDQRMPMGKPKVYTANPSDMFFTTGDWTGGFGTTYISAANSSPSSVNAICKWGGRSSRLLGAQVWWQNSGSSVAKIAKYQESDAGGGGININFIKLHNTTLENTTSGLLRKMCQKQQFEGQHDPSVGPTILQDATSKIGPPVWTNGWRCPCTQLDSFDLFEAVMVWLSGSASASTKITKIQFIIAEGL